MKVLIALTYYVPHLSGLTIYVQRLAEGLAARGHYVTLLTSRYDNSLPTRETRNGVRIVRAPVAARVSKGVLMPTIGGLATRLARQHDALSIHLPQLDAAGIALRGKLMGKPTILTYHCDLQLPQGPLSRAIDEVIFSANYGAATFADRIVAYTQDYADHSRLLSRFASKITVVPPPVIMAEPQPAQVEAFKCQHALNGGPLIGMAARLATEKGVEYLAEAVPLLLQRFPNLKVLFAGPYQNVMGEAAYWHKLQPLIERLGAHWEFLGSLTPDEMPTFFGACAAQVVSSINSTESFGLVQVEAMLCGTPVVATNLPGVRAPVRMTGMGEVVPTHDAPALAHAIGNVIEHRARYLRPRSEIAQIFDLDRTLTAYETLLQGRLPTA